MILELVGAVGAVCVLAAVFRSNDGIARYLIGLLGLVLLIAVHCENLSCRTIVHDGRAGVQRDSRRTVSDVRTRSMAPSGE